MFVRVFDNYIPSSDKTPEETQDSVTEEDE
jgi:hypothetical protein